MADTVDSLRSELETATAERDAARADRVAALAERDAAFREGAAADVIADAFAERDGTLKELDVERGRNERLKAEHEVAVAERDVLRGRVEHLAQTVRDLEGTVEMRCVLAQEHESRDEHVLKTFGVGGSYRMAFRRMLELRNELNAFALELGMPEGEQIPDLVGLVKELRAARAEKRDPVRPPMEK